MSRTDVDRSTASDTRDNRDPNATPKPRSSGTVVDFLLDKSNQNNIPVRIWTASTKETKNDSVGATPDKNASAPIDRDEIVEVRTSFFRSVHFTRVLRSTYIPRGEQE